MIDIVVSRGSNRKEGDPFVNPLLSDPYIAEVKGAALLDEFAEDHSTLILTIPYTSGLCLGQTVRVDEGVNSLIWVGKVVALNHKVSDGTFTTEITIDKGELQ